MLLFESDETDNSSNYRPITCLNTMYKVFTRVMNLICIKRIEQLQLIPKKKQRVMKATETAYLHAMLRDQYVIGRA